MGGPVWDPDLPSTSNRTTPQEGYRLLAEVASHGLCRGENWLLAYVICELPRNPGASPLLSDPS